MIDVLRIGWILANTKAGEDTSRVLDESPGARGAAYEFAAEAIRQAVENGELMFTNTVTLAEIEADAQKKYPDIRDREFVGDGSRSRERDAYSLGRLDARVLGVW